LVQSTIFQNRGGSAYPWIHVHPPLITIIMYYFSNIMHQCGNNSVIFECYEQKKKDEEKAREKELNDLFKVAVSQPKVPVGM
jgi:hypothetical protein